MTDILHESTIAAGKGYAPRTRRLLGAGTRLSPATFLACFAASFAAVTALVWLYVATMPMAFLSRDYPLWIAKREMLDQCRPGAVAVFGDSRTLAAVVPELMPIPVTNLAMSGTSPIETYFAVERALRCPAPPKLVVIAHGALKFGGDGDYWNFSARTGFLSYDQMRAVDADAARLHDDELQRLRRGDHLSPALRDALFAARFPGLYFDSLVNAFVATRLSHNRDAYRDALRASGHALFGSANGTGVAAGEGQQPGFQVSPLVDLYFDRTLALLAEHRVPAVVISMPVSRTTSAATQPRLREQFATYLHAKERTYPGLQVAGPAIPCWPDEFFGDDWHFNARGADAYSRALGPWLRDVAGGGAVRDVPGRCDPDSTSSRNPRSLT
jgi:hypothetical protein